MCKKFDVIALGELLIDFTENGVSGQGNPMFEANPGGAPCNVLAMLNKLGKKTSFLGVVGKDQFENISAVPWTPLVLIPATYMKMKKCIQHLHLFIHLRMGTEILHFTEIRGRMLQEEQIDQVYTVLQKPFIMERCP